MFDYNQPGEWITPDCVQWGKWDDNTITLTDDERKALTEAHFPYQFSEEKACNIKRLVSKGYMIERIVKHFDSQRGYSRSSIMKITGALSKANSEKTPAKSPSPSNLIDYQRLINV